MKTNLLLGYGINLDFGISELYAEAILHRFQNILIKTSPIYEYLMGKGFDAQICNSIFADCINNTEKLGIESLARKVYDYLKDPDKWSVIDYTLPFPCCQHTLGISMSQKPNTICVL